MRRIKPISHEERLSIIDHLDELRSRIVISLVAFGVAFGLCVWQNHLILDILNRPLPDGTHPLTFGVTEPFMTTITNSGYAAILITLPILLYEIYAFVLPAFSPRERRVALPLLLMIPLLFIAGVVFCYFIVLPPAIKFLLQFNADEFNTQVRARDYYSFTTLTMLAMGLGFQVPVVLLGLVRLDIVSVETLRKNRRYAILGSAVLAMLLPTIDPVSMLIETVPIYALYELSILLGRLFGGRARGGRGRGRVRRGRVASLRFPMLFDLRGKRRRAVQATYLTLALLMGGGLVFFGVGGNVSGGLLDAFKGGGGGSTGNKVVEDRIDKNKAAAAAGNERALKEMVRDYYQLATGQTSASATGFPDSAKDELANSGRYWKRYLKVTEKPDSSLARVAVQVYDVTALNKPKDAEEAAQVIAQTENDSSAYLGLVQYASLAGDKRTADLAAIKAVDLAPKGQKKQVQLQAKQLKQAGTQPQVQQGG